MNLTTSFIGIAAYLILAPIAGGLLAGVDRKISARMQGRYGPPILQPFYDFFKLLEKEPITVNKVQDFLFMCFLIFIIITDLLLRRRRSAAGHLYADPGKHLPVWRHSRPTLRTPRSARKGTASMMAYEPMVCYGVDSTFVRKLQRIGYRDLQ
jgi:hypothetical protein